MANNYEVRNKEIEMMLKDIGNRIGSVLPTGWGFNLLIFDFGKKEDGSMFYVSNANRDDMIAAMKEFIVKHDTGKNLSTKLNDLADKYEIPSIITWRQGRFIDGPDYKRWPQELKDKAEVAERRRIRPGGGKNNPLFQVAGSANDSNIAAYLSEVAELLSQEGYL